MAEKRMFSKIITETDAFLDMPKSTQCLYFHLNMNADDDGFVASPKKTMRIIGASDDDMNILISKRFIIPFETQICVIKHWLIHNTIRKDRKKETTYIEEKSRLEIKENDSYSLMQPIDNQLTDNCQHRLDKIRLDKVSIDKNSTLYVEIVTHLNDVCNTTYKDKTKKTRTLIDARLKEGFTLEDFKIVIEFKAYQWLNNESYRHYLRPETLFGNKFESYLQSAKVEVNKQQEKIDNYVRWDEF